MPVSVMNPARVRQFARASGHLAKTDPIDAAVLTAFGQAFAPAPTPPRRAVAIKLAALVTRRAQLLELRSAETQRADTCADAALGKLFTAWLTQVKKQIAKVEALLEELLEAQEALASQVQRLDDIMGVGRITAVAVLAAMPELGQLNRGQAAALAGLAPTTATVATGLASATSAAGGPKHAPSFTWRRSRPAGATPCSRRFTTA